MTVVYRTTGAWGSGKGSNLTPAEVDGNFWDHEGRIDALETTPPTAISIDDITVVSNQLTITLTDATVLGPFTLPTSALRWTGAFAGSTVYAENDLFSRDGAIWLVLQDHTSTAPFNPADGDGDGPFYQLLLQTPNAYDLGFFFPGTPGFGINADDPLAGVMLARDAYLKATAPGSLVKIDVAPTADIDLDIRKNGTIIGTINIAAAATTGTITVATATQFAAGDRLSISRSTASDDATGFNLYMTIVVTLGTIPV